ncbi:group III truncated hemoglobin [Aquimarina pacifica]|uniref:group III truncated hemoglobin n=1 Tax=Aquimarina pacifica TaxID=1296415 RepID=UPI0004B0D183|nr:group III truncated hemoglobin [Aquimarina pacifica]
MNPITKKDIQNRDDIQIIVSKFYEKVRNDQDLGPIFNAIIDDWDSHIKRLVDFWETNLLFVQKFKGNPIKAHQEVDKKNNHKITNIHFGIWLRLWITTIDTQYEGTNATLAKDRARKIGTTLFIKIHKNRNLNSFSKQNDVKPQQ